MHRSPTMQMKSLTMKKGLLFALFVLFLTACAKPKDFDYRDVRNIKIGKMGFDKTDLSMDIVYFNPNRFGVDLKKVDADVYLENKYLGKFQLDTAMHIAGKSEFLLPARIQIDLKTVVQNGISLLFNREVLINVKGTSRVGRAGFYKTIPFNYEAKHSLSLFQ